MGIKNSKIDLPVFSNKETTLDKIKNEIKPFDLICFRGNEFVSNAISKVQKLNFGNGDWTHVGLVISQDILPFKNAKSNKIYIWESTISGSFGDGVNNQETGNGKFGIQIRDLDKVINKYIKTDITKIGWCKLINNPYDMKNTESTKEYRERIQKIKNDIQKFYLEHGNSKYDYKIITMIKTIFPSIGKNKLLKRFFHTENLYFCSEFVATIYEIIGIISKDIDPEEIAPIELLGFSNNNIGKIVEEPILLCKKKSKL